MYSSKLVKPSLSGSALGSAQVGQPKNLISHQSAIPSPSVSTSSLSWHFKPWPKSLHQPDSQSLSILQVLPTKHLSQIVPPQSISLSSWSKNKLVQDGSGAQIDLFPDL